ncbi:MAG TPA: YciI family protein [Chloroflexota bacterium]|nr:YciI family protein [Chloroflexota bacterium]
MPKYAALIYGTEGEPRERSDPESQKVWQAYMAYTEDVQKSGILRGGEGLMPTATATTVRVKDGQVLTTDGPFAETKEQLGGFYLFECKDLDEAIAWAARIPGCQWGGSIELRPVIEM